MQTYYINIQYFAIIPTSLLTTVSVSLRAIEEGTHSSFINKSTDYFLLNEQDRGKCFPVHTMIPRLSLIEQDANESQYFSLFQLHVPPMSAGS